MKVGVLGSLGLALLLYTVTTVIQKIERSFNSIWQIRKTRSLARRFSDYISVIIIGPVMIFTAMGLTASFRSNTIVMKILSIEPFGTMFFYGAKLIPYLMVCSAFTFLYIFLPNTKVKFSSALAGGVLAGIVWEVAGWGFASFVVSSAKYAAIYSGFAILLMFMIWLYVSWLILLVGAQVSFYHQYPHFLLAKKNIFKMSNRLRERLALLIMYVIGHSHYYDERPCTLDMLVERLGTPVDPVYDIIILLEKNGLLLETGDDPPAYVPKKDIETISLKELLYVVRVAEPQALYVERKVLHVTSVEEVLQGVNDSLSDALDGKTLKDVVTAGE
jgi:membrane protein